MPCSNWFNLFLFLLNDLWICINTQTRPTEAFTFKFPYYIRRALTNLTPLNVCKPVSEELAPPLLRLHCTTHASCCPCSSSAPRGEATSEQHCHSEGREEVFMAYRCTDCHQRLMSVSLCCRCSFSPCCFKKKGPLIAFVASVTVR